ncbi:outer membrane lipoprotein carrier protein LolA [Qipengyuania sp. 1NDW9]|uniref:Outer membrane lipoprotein carrier protein LolA n=2 Tax=Qipengyuania TaxID=1855416 RepID=A0A9Q3XD96_9SPHN|nr:MULTISPECIES: outer membrane lipoprotein carrier protein LolA [Qipengyuania]MBX7491966.1 outer membrane lipoprotein carrier protein LolA [Qipengyuania xiapuensis]MBY6127616.1 outer membrane lipoprotein carrier protein LolA [Qipengyuania aquimaris]MBY6218842.1 outer membrane lipoprotein carrier protein LolA [Qipengyuania aquimaris]QZD91335.1 outer membrane lipoprotein carrier protein LolA [Qipengyuania xiapuensis]UOR15892.1 outer membrane lipoprotein carrier protein LolA [Qipengyuania aquima
MNTLTIFKNRPVISAVAFAMAVGVPASFYATPAPVVAQTGDLDRAVEALRGISTMKADFVQTDRNGQAVSGVMTLKRPGKIRFEYEKGVDLLVVSNGKSMYMVDYAVSQVQRWPIKNSPLGALLDPSRDVKKYGRLVPTSHSDVVSIEVRDKSRPEFGVITLIFARDASAPGGLRLTHWVALDSQNHRTTVRLRNHRYGMAVADSTFSFRDPRRSSRRPG